MADWGLIYGTDADKRRKAGDNKTMEQAEINPGWEHDYQTIRNIVSVELPMDDIMDVLYNRGLLDTKQISRSRWKIKLIEPFVTRMVVNMIKGTLKYASDDWPDETWEDMGRDDKADGNNYDLLWQDKLRKEGKI